MLHQKVTRELPTLEHLALNRLRERFPPFQRRGLATTIRKAFPDIQPEEIRFIPDGWFIKGDLLAGELNGQWATVTCIEIEDKHPLTAEKLFKYCDLWFTLNFYCCDLRLFVFDRYGLSERELALGILFFEIMVETARVWRQTASPAELEAARNRAIPIGRCRSAIEQPEHAGSVQSQLGELK
jgi:hypothetical protein